MATDVTVAPTNGAAVLFTNGGTGSTPGYNAIDVRRMIRAGLAFQEGVFASGDWKVTERGAGTNMTVDVAANLDVAVVKNDALLTPRDYYIVAPHSAAINLGTVGGNTSGNPRLDYIVLQVRNQDHDGSSQYDARVRYLTGTANAAASHSNPAGAPTIPDTAVLLAQVLVPTGTTSAITNAMIRDRRPWACGVNAKATRSTNWTPSGSTAEVDTTNLKVRVECSGAPMEITLWTGVHAGNTAGRLQLSVGLDGTTSAMSGEVLDFAPTNSIFLSQTLHYVAEGISAGSHYFTVVQNVVSGTMGAGGAGAYLRLREQPTGLTNNGTV